MKELDMVVLLGEEEGQWLKDVKAQYIDWHYYMNINLFIVLAAPFFSLLFTEPPDLLITTNPTNSYLQMILLNMGASISIFLINTTGYRYDFAKLFPIVDIGLVSLELLELGCFINSMEIRYGLYVFKKVCTGMAIGANFYLGVVMLKRKFTLER